MNKFLLMLMANGLIMMDTPDESNPGGGSSQLEDVAKAAAEKAAEKVAGTVKTTAEDAVKTYMKGFGLDDKPDHKTKMANFLSGENSGAFSAKKTIKSVKETDGLEKGVAFARMIKLTHQAKFGNHEGLSREDFMNNTAEKHYKKDVAFNAMIKHMTGRKIDKSSEIFQNVTHNVDGGYLVQEMYGDIIELLRERTFLYKVGARVTPMPKGNLNLPVHAEGALSYFIGEGKPIFPKVQKFQNIKLTAKKQVSMVLMSDELLMDNSYDADRRLLEDILREMEIVMNYVALYGRGGEFEPKGITKYTGITTKTIAALPDGDLPANMKGEIMKTNVAGTNLAYVMNGALWAPLYNITDGNGVYINRTPMDAGNLVGSPFHIFNRIPVADDAKKTTDLFFADWSNFEIGEQEMFQIDVSKEASIKDANGETVNLFQQGMTAIKVTSFYDFALRHQEGFVWYKEVNTIA